MRKLYFLFILSFVVYGCTSKFSQFNEDAVTLVSNDGHVDQMEYEKLQELIRSSDERGFQSLKAVDGKIDNAKVVAYLLKYFSAKKINVTRDDIWQPEVSKNVEKFNINVFLENSASIDGYVGDNSTFKTTVFKLLTDLKNFPFSDSLNLNYINTKPIPIKISASRDDIDDFYRRLNPSDFKSAGGMRGSTDIEKMLKQLLDRANHRNLSVFISDCVFSPGRNDAKKYLDGQYAAIYNDFISAKTINSELSIIILQCVSKFEGTYFDYLDKPHLNISAERPYYIWFIGSLPQISSLVDHKLFDLIRNGYKNKLVIQSIKDVSEPNYKILYRPRTGEFDSKSLAQGIISGAAAAKDERNKGLFGFNVAVDYSKSLQDPNFFLDSANSELSDKRYSLKIEPIVDRSDPALTGFTHILSLKTNALTDGTVRIDVIGKTPSWVYETTSNNDTRIETDESERQKTFGFKYLVEGVCDAFYPKSRSNAVSSINISVRK